MDSESSRYLQDYYDSQNMFSYLNTLGFYEDVKELIRNTDSKEAESFAQKVKLSLEKDHKKSKAKLKSKKVNIVSLSDIVYLKVVKNIFDKK